MYVGVGHFKKFLVLIFRNDLHDLHSVGLCRSYTKVAIEAFFIAI